MEFVSLMGDFGKQKIPKSNVDFFFFSRDRTEIFQPPNNLFASQAEIDDDLWFFQIKPRATQVSPVYISVLRDCYVLPGGAVVTAKGELIAESLYPVIPDDFELGGGFVGNPADSEWLQRIVNKQAEGVEVLDRAVHCRDLGESGYFHWVATVLPRIALVSGNFEGNTGPYLIQPNSDFGDEWLKLVFPSIELRPQNGSCIFVRELIYAAPAQVGNSHYKRNPWLLKNFRRHLEQLGLLIPPSKKTDSRIYISRSDAPVRRLTNEKELFGMLELRGFKSHCLSGMSVASQIELFANAEVIVSPHGAGLTNLIFSKSGATVIEIMSRTRTWPGFKVISHAMGLQYNAYVSNVFAEDQVARRGVGNEDFSVNLLSCSRFIDACTFDG